MFDERTQLSYWKYLNLLFETLNVIFVNYNLVKSIDIYSKETRDDVSDDCSS